MKIVTDYSDGQYSMMPLGERESWMDDEYWRWREAGAIEISAEEWAEYQAFIDVANKWHNRIAVLDNQAWEQRTPVDTDQKP